MPESRIKLGFESCGRGRGVSLGFVYACKNASAQGPALTDEQITIAACSLYKILSH